MVLDNDTRGWIMAATSGIACTFGAAIICVDLLVQQLPGRRRFKIQDSNPFLSAGLSLSFGVMICSSLYSMLPSARSYLQKGGLAPRPAGFVMVACFLVGALGIAVLSRIIHRFIPHSVVDCSHDHGDEEENLKQTGEDEDVEAMSPTSDHCHAIDGTGPERLDGYPALPNYGTMLSEQNMPSLLRRPSISSRVSKLVTGHKEFCDEQGQCHGYSDPCGQECFKIVQQTRGGARQPGAISKGATRPSGLRTATAPQERHHLLENVDEEALLVPFRSDPAVLETTSEVSGGFNGSTDSVALKHSRSASVETQETVESHDSHAHYAHRSRHAQNGHGTHHHHHVPTNVFLSIGLQTSIAIALHKLPEGFITYATNHANPRLGVTVFLALFIHNITEGFAMALPLYLAINSRWKAMFWSALLGGFTQPMGAGLAALWFRVAGRDQGRWGPGERVYGVMFAMTAGIMAMVALQLFGESLDLTHSRKLCFGFAFAGMGILGLSSALTA